MEVKKLTLSSGEIPEAVCHIPAPPAQLYVACQDLGVLLQQPRLAVVGSRKITPYGKTISDTLAMLVAQAGIVIVSGLAYGVDAVAHRAALQAGRPTIAVLPGSLEAIYPAGHRNLAAQIIKQGGALITEYSPGTRIYAGNFIARNRIIAALSSAILITEAAQKSGALHTARFALEQGKDVLAVPGPITSPMSVGANNLIKRGAAPVTEASDIFHILGVSTQLVQRTPKGDTPNEQLLIDILQQGALDGDQLHQQSELPIHLFNQAVSMLEIKGVVRPLGANLWALA